MIVGVDIGGTFTDVVCIDRRSGEIHFTKVSTNYTNPAFPKYRRYSVRREGDSAIRIKKL